MDNGSWGDSSMYIGNLIEQRRRDILSTCEKYGAKNIRLFGSCARGTATETSDVDILVDLSSAKLTGFRYFGCIEGIAEDLEKLLGVRVDVVDEARLPNEIRKAILSEASAL